MNIGDKITLIEGPHVSGVIAYEEYGPSGLEGYMVDFEDNTSALVDKDNVKIFCNNCDGMGWVCENHPNKPWDGISNRKNACGCGAGMPCGKC